MCDNIKVSICCLTFNHERFIQKALDSFLMQKTNFGFEILIHDDASTDSTQDIIRNYQEKYPDIIKPIFQTENQWSKGITSLSATYNFPRAKGIYIAMCEGDDYWTDSLKLQKQVDFLDKNSQYSFVCGGFIIKNQEEQTERMLIKEELDHPDHSFTKGFDITFNRVKKEWLIKTLTILFRKDAFDLSVIRKYKYARDVQLFYHLLKSGKGYYLKEVLGAYTVHDKGVHSGIGDSNKKIIAYNVYEELYRINLDEYSRYKYFNFVLQIIIAIPKDKSFVFPKSKFNYFFEALKLVKNKIEFFRLIKAMIPYLYQTKKLAAIN